MTDFGILLKSHAPDLPYVERALASFTRHNVDAVPLFLVVPDDQLPVFSPAAASHDRVTLIGESILAGNLVTEEVAGFSPGYINQEIVKLAFWETGLASNYLCLDSDASFIRDFRRSDFMLDATTPFTFASEDFDLEAEPEYFADHWRHRQPRLARIAAELGMPAEPLRTVHGHAVFSGTALRTFREQFLGPRGWSYSDALAIAPYEPTWYTLWVQASGVIPVEFREPVFKTFHNASQHLSFLLRGLTSEDLARGYVGVVVNSNYSRSAGVLDVDESLPVALGHYLDERSLLRAAVKR